jgi:hypothetical protein
MSVIEGLNVIFPSQGTNYVWNTSTLAWERMTQPSTGDLTVYTDPLVQYKISDMDESGSTAYYGYVKSDGGWYIMSKTTTAIRYCTGSSGYVAAWAGRAGQSYDYFYSVF